MKKVVISPGEDPSLVHVGDNNLAEFGKEVKAYMERRMREMNPDHPLDAELCWGCIGATIHNVVIEFAANHEFTDMEPSDFMKNVGSGINTLAFQLKMKALLKDQREIDIFKQDMKNEDAERELEQANGGDDE